MALKVKDRINILLLFITINIYVLGLSVDSRRTFAIDSNFRRNVRGIAVHAKAQIDCGYCGFMQYIYIYM
jgi:hypothetical protein